MKDIFDRLDYYLIRILLLTLLLISSYKLVRHELTNVKTPGKIDSGHTSNVVD
jgi:hypothetical protein